MSKSGSGIILLNDKNEVVLILRDNIPSIPYPGFYDLPGGHIESDENAEKAVRREIKEELGIDDLGDISFYKSHQNQDFIDNIFWKRINLDLSKINLSEGQAVKYFSPREIREMKLAFDYEKLLEKFFREVFNYE